MIVTLTPNPAIDLTYHLPGFGIGDSQRVPPAQLRAGGKGINVARVLHGQGYRAHAIVPIRDEFGSQFSADLQASGIEHTTVPAPGTTRRTIAIVTPTETTNLNESGTAMDHRSWQRLVEVTLAALEQAAAASAANTTPVLVCSGSMPPDPPPGFFRSLLHGAHALGARTIVDTSGPHLLAAADAGADVLKPNRAELQHATGDEDLLRAARSLARRGGVDRLVYLSLGADGMLAVPVEGPVLHARLERALSGNTTGAGDAAVAAIATVASLPDGTADTAHTLRLATAWSAAAVEHPLAGSLTDPQARMAQVGISEFAPEGIDR
ncbi:MAG: 1-phosphofructokinase family hexose kinase [Beutenbergiaceae bacterium]